MTPIMHLAAYTFAACIGILIGACLRANFLETSMRLMQSQIENLRRQLLGADIKRDRQGRFSK